MITVRDIYNILDAVAPFSTQESYDNSGLLVGDANSTVSHVLLALDITTPVVAEAAAIGAQLIVSHHPVIWGGLKSISPDHPVWHLITHNIAAIASHTCMDIAENGTNAAIADILRKHIGFCGDPTPLHVLSGGKTLGLCCDLQGEMNAEALAKKLQEAFQCRGLRYYAANRRPIRRIAWCGGSGGDMLADAIACNADALITGDLKHSEWCEAVNRSMTVFDCEHFSTEQPVLEQFRGILKNALPELKISMCEAMQVPTYDTISE